MSSSRIIRIYSCLLTNSITYDERGEERKELVTVLGRERNEERNWFKLSRRERERGRERERESRLTLLDGYHLEG